MDQIWLLKVYGLKIKLLKIKQLPVAPSPTCSQAESEFYKENS
jgi:hypothetical protein